jgi:hypothetical protein
MSLSPLSLNISKPLKSYQFLQDMIAPLLLHLLVNLTVGDRMSKDSWELLELISILNLSACTSYLGRTGKKLSSLLIRTIGLMFINKLKMLKINKSGLLSIISKS